MALRLINVLAAAAILSLCGCAPNVDWGGVEDALIVAPPLPPSEGAVTDATVMTTAAQGPALPWGSLSGPQAAADGDGPYLLDTGDRLRVFVYGQPNLSRLYIVDHEGFIAVPLIGRVMARGYTAKRLEAKVRSELGKDYVRDPQVTVEVQQNRPFFILGEVKTAGQYPYVSGMTVETAIAIAGGYSERASMRRYRITRRTNGFVEEIEAPGDYVILPGDTVTVFERFF